MAIEKTINLNVNTSKGVKNVKDLNKELDQTQKEVKQSSESVKQMSGNIDGLTGGAISKFGKFKNSISAVTGGFNSLKVAIISSGIGALALGIIAIVQAFKRSEEGQNKFAKIMGVIGAVTGQFLDLLADLGEKIIWVFENPKKAINDFTKLLKENIINRFEGLMELIPALGKAINLLFSGEFSEAGKVAADAVGKVALGVENITDKVVEATKAIKDFVDETVKEAEIAAKIADQRASADKKERSLLVQRALANKKIAELREKAADKDKVSVEERIKALEEAGRISEDITNKEIEATNLRLKAKQAENALGKSTKADLDEEAQLKAKIIDLDAQRLTKQKSLTAEVTNARREAQALIDADAKAKQDKIDADNKIINNAESKRLQDLKKLTDDFNAKLEEEKAVTEAEKLELEKTKQLEELERLKASQEEKLKVKEYYSNKITEATKAALDEQAKNEQILQTAKENMAKNTFSNISKALGENTKAGKAAAAAASLINTYQGITAELATKTVTPFEFGIKLANIATTAAIGFKSVKDILKTNPKNTSGGGSSSATGAQSTQAAAPQFNIVGQGGTNQLAESIGSQTQEPIQAYVVSNDVTTAQSMQNNIVQGASIG